MSRFVPSYASILAWGLLVPVCFGATARADEPSLTLAQQVQPSFAFGSQLPKGALARLGTHALRHCDNLSALAFSPDGSLLVTVGRDHATCLWERATGRLLHRIFDSEVDFGQVAFAPDGKRLVLSCCKPGRAEGCYLQIYDTTTGKELHRLPGHEQPVYAIWFVPGEATFWSISCDRSIHWEMNLGGVIEQRVQDWPTGILAVAQDRPILAFASNKRDDPLIQLVSPLTGKTLLTIDGELKEVPDPKFPDRTQAKIVRPEQAIVALALSPDGCVLASGSPFEHIRLWDVATGQLLRTLEDQQGGIALAFAPDGKSIASGTINGLVRLWDVASGKELRKFPGFKAWVNALAFSPDGTTLAMAGAESRMLYLWDVKTGKDLRPGPGHRGPVQGLGFSADGRYLTTAGAGRDDAGQAICVWEAGTGQLLQQFGKFDARVLAFAFSGDGKRLALAQEHQTLPLLFEIPSGKSSEPFQLPADLAKGDNQPDLRFTALCYSTDGKRLAGGGSDGKVLFWDSATGKCVRWWKAHPSMITSLTFSPDGKKLLTAAEDRTARLWDATTGKELVQLAQGEDSFGNVRISPDGTLAAAVSAWCDGKVYLWDLQTGKELKRIPLTAKRINQIAFSPNGKMLAACDIAGKISLVEVATGKPRAVFAGHLGEITALAFSPDGLQLATGSADTTTLLWDATGGNLTVLLPRPPLSEIHLAKLWHDLAGDDATLAYRAMWQLAASPEQAESFLHDRVKPVVKQTPEQIQQMIRDLDHYSYAKRALAMSALINLGKAAEPYLQDALKQKPSPELYQRTKELLGRLELVELSAEQVRLERALETLAWIGTKNTSTGLHAQRNGK